MTARVYIVRHGNTFDPGDVVLRVGGRTDLPLSSSGRLQADQLGRSLIARGVAFTTAAAAPLRRARETATAILSHQGTPPDLLMRPGLREIDYGPDEGQPETAVRARIGDAAIDAWERDMVPPPGWRVDPVAMIANWQALLADLRETPGDHLLVTSNGVARFALRAVAASAATPDLSAKLATAAYGVIRLAPDGDAVLEWNVRAP
ncbi:histidine phosphatase family protein [bacterium]|nr:histidine phosphatase family protein [bacterium]